MAPSKGSKNDINFFYDPNVIFFQKKAKIQTNLASSSGHDWDRGSQSSWSSWSGDLDVCSTQTGGRSCVVEGGSS
jgi:hypothetical protein